MPDFILKVLEDRSTQLILRYTAIGCAWVSSKMHCTISDVISQGAVSERRGGASSVA